jgi:hypothetical protein
VRTTAFHAETQGTAETQGVPGDPSAWLNHEIHFVQNRSSIVMRARQSSLRFCDPCVSA